MMFFTVLRLGLFILSLAGFAVFFEKKLKIVKKASWFASCCMIILTLSFSAYAGLLRPAAIFLFVGGLFMAGAEGFRKVKNKDFSLEISPFLFAGLLFYFLLFSVTLLNSRLEHYDNYSHWAVIVKFLYTEGRLPNAADSIISFTSYPLGSSFFVYYAVLIAGFGDQVMLMGQFILLFSCFYAMFAVVRDEKRTLIVNMFLVFLTLFNFFNIAIRMNNLLVDFLLPMMTLAGLSGIYRMQHQVKQMSFYLFLTAASLSLVKNSALFFVFVLFLYYFSRLYLLQKRRSYKTKRKLLLVGISTSVISLLPIYLWNLHVKQTFDASKHEVSIDAYQQIFGEKSSAITEQISRLFLSTVSDPATLSTQGILLANIIFIAGYLLIRLLLKRRNSLLRYLILTDLVVAAYYAGIYFMFLFSMPTEEALYLAGFERYASSVVILALGIAAMVLAREIDYSFYEQNVNARSYRSFKSLEMKKWYEYTSMLLLFFAVLLLLSENNGMLYNNSHFPASIPGKFSKSAGSRMDLNQERFLVVSTDKEAVDSYLVDYAGKYYLYSPYVDGREDFLMEDESFLELLKQYDKVVILEDHFTFDAMTEKLFGKTLEPGVYRTREIINS